MSTEPRMKLTVPSAGPLVMGAIVIGTYGLAYFATTLALRVPEASNVVSRMWRRA